MKIPSRFRCRRNKQNRYAPKRSPRLVCQQQTWDTVSLALSRSKLVLPGRRPCRFSLITATRGMSRITINASNFGFGPIQSSHVRNKVVGLRQRIEQMLHQGARAEPRSNPTSESSQHPSQSPPRPPTTPTGQPGPARQVFVNGKQLRDDQVNFLEQKYRSPLPNGHYWYDRMCGAWGVMGGPVLCTLEPNHDIGGPLQPGASNGNTGVFINGRE